MDKLRQQAEELGLEGSDIFKYVTQQQQIDREEREREREFQKIKMLNDQHARDTEARVLQHERDLAAQQQARDHEAAQQVREHELELARLAVPIPGGAGAVNNDMVVKVERPKLPVFHDGDDLTSYLVRFERVSTLLNINEDSYAVRLGSLLGGRAGEIYASLSPEITADYQLLKDALLLAFNKNPDTYRSEFRSARILPNETYLQFMTTLTCKFNFWMNSAKVPLTMDGVREFMILDQLLASVPMELRLFLKERGSLSLTETVTCADNWRVARQGLKRPNFSNFSPPNLKSEPIVQRPSNPSLADVGAVKSKARSDHSNVKCHNCGEVGHYKSRCPTLFSGRNQKPGGESVKICTSQQIDPKYLTCGTLNGANVSTILRDTGCSCVIVATQLLPDLDTSNCKRVSLADYLGRVSVFPVARCYLRCIFFMVLLTQ